MLHAHLENALRVLLYLGIDFSADLHYRSVISFLWSDMWSKLISDQFFVVL